MAVDAVICAKNEKRTIGKVVRAVRKSGAVGKVIVVDDQSTDGTGWRARLAGAQVIDGPGRGKGAAMRAGLAATSADRILFCDADIAGLRPWHVRMLTRDFPDTMLVGLRDNGSRLLPLPAISGERCVPAWLVRSLPLEGYSAETQINAAAGNAGLGIYHTTLRGVTNPRREPIKRTGQVLRATLQHLLGLSRYLIGWLCTTVKGWLTKCYS